MLAALGSTSALAQVTAPGTPQRAGDPGRLVPAMNSSASQPIVIEADRLWGIPDVEAAAEGKVEFRRGPLSLRADRIHYALPQDTARASGNVEVLTGGNSFRGPELSLQIQRFEGYFLEPSYFFARTQAGGTARRIDFLDENRSVATGATYTSCPPDDPAWMLSTDRVSMDFGTNEGVAEGAVLRFLGVPILAAPTLSFPLTDARKSGWLPPSINIDNKSGLELMVPWYWNIAPNRDLTLTPAVFTRRGVGLGSEFRYLEPGFEGRADFNYMPQDRLADRSRWTLNLEHKGLLRPGDWLGEIEYDWNLQRASDDEYWKDFSRILPSLTPRLLPGDLRVRRYFDTSWGLTEAYARVQSWQTLQDPEPESLISPPPYRREPQVGVRQFGNARGFDWRWELEANRFSNEDRDLQSGSRVHAIGSAGYTWLPTGTPGWAITPRASFNAASYDLEQPLADGSMSASRVIPTVSLDSRWVFERSTEAFGRAITQTLEPRLLYVSTPFRDQSRLPNFDSAPNDFNFTSIFAENVFSGVDRVSDVNQLTAGAITRYLDRDSGAEALRLGIAQRLLFSDQQITADGAPLTQRWSDVLFTVATNVVPHWWFDGTVQYSPQINSSIRSVIGARYSPGPLRTVNMTYRFTRDNSEQVELGWQWPLNAAARAYAAELGERDQTLAAGGQPLARRATAGNSSCKGAWYSVGRLNYSLRDSRLTDAIVGFEYDAGCWIARIVGEQLSTGRSEATTRLLLQLELVGLSRIGSNPLGVLRDNIAGYRLLRDDAVPANSALTLP
ncbi:LPS-assembly protein LptD [Rivibacter subsaxonicus]|nr:LPS assembly protein LptD [Rivibacter subsaxonicus]